jgi:ribosomal protein L37AE/L43A
MVAVSAIVGATFAVGGGYLLVGALRALLIGGSFSQYTLKRVGIAAGTFGVGVYLIHRAASQAAAATASAATKAQIVKTIQGAAEGSVDSYGGNLGITINGDWALGDYFQNPCAINIQLDPEQAYMLAEPGWSTNTTQTFFKEIVEDGRDPKEVIDEDISTWAGDNWRQELKDGTSGYAAEHSITVYKIVSEVQDIGNWGHGQALDSITSHNSWRTKEGALKAMREMADQEAQQWAHSMEDHFWDKPQEELTFSFVEDSDWPDCLTLTISNPNQSPMTQEEFQHRYTMVGNKGDHDYDGMTYSMCVRESALMDAEGALQDCQICGNEEYMGNEVSPCTKCEKSICHFCSWNMYAGLDVDEPTVCLPCGEGSDTAVESNYRQLNTTKNAESQSFAAPLVCPGCSADLIQVHEYSVTVCKDCGRQLTEQDYYNQEHWGETPPLSQDELDAESFEAPMGYDPEGPRPFYGNPRKLIYDRWGNRRFMRRRRDGTYMDNVDVVRSIRMDRQRKAKTWAPGGFRDQGDGSMELLANLLGAESFKDWADEEDEEHGDISFDKWIREEMEEPTHESNPPDSLTFLKWAGKERKGHTFESPSNDVEDSAYDQSYSITWSE